MPTAVEKAEAVRKRVREALILFEHKEGSGTVDIKDVGMLIHRLGVNPTGPQITHVVDELARWNADEGDGSSLLQVEHLEAVVTSFLIQQESALARDDYHMLIRAFRAFDTEGKGWVDADSLRLLMTSRGDPMTDDEAHKMLMFSADENGRIYYEDYAQKLATDGRTI